MPPHQIFELRNYTLHPGQRDVLIDLFEREFVETQEAVGMRVVATFRDLDAPDHFVWLRSFPDMPSRAASLGAFYGGPVWQTHRNAANATIVDSDNVLLLRPVSGRLTDQGASRPSIGSAISATLFVATTYLVSPQHEAAFSETFSAEIAPAWRDAGASILATFATEHSENTYPRLPVREGECVFVALSRFASVGAYDAHVKALNALPHWREIEERAQRFLIAPKQTLRLQPTARSALR